MQSLAHVFGLKKTDKKGRVFIMLEILKEAQTSSLLWLAWWLVGLPVLFLIGAYLAERREDGGQTDFIGNQRSRWKA